METHHVRRQNSARRLHPHLSQISRGLEDRSRSHLSRTLNFTSSPATALACHPAKLPLRMRTRPPSTTDFNLYRLLSDWRRRLVFSFPLPRSIASFASRSAS